MWAILEFLGDALVTWGHWRVYGCTFAGITLGVALESGMTYPPGILPALLGATGFVIGLAWHWMAWRERD